MASSDKLLILGPRRYSNYAVSIIDSFVPSLCERGITVVSGMDFGVSELVFKSVIGSGGIGWAYLPFGLKFLKRNKEHSNLARKLVAKGGRVLSPFKSGQKPSGDTFAYRNKLLIDSCDVALVIEAAIDGGTIKTAMLALEMGKPVYVIPGSAFGYASAGCNHLLNFGAQAATSVNDILLLS